MARVIVAERSKSAVALSGLQAACDRRVVEIETRAKLLIAEAREESQALAEQLTATQAQVVKSEEAAKRAEERARAADGDRRRAAELHSEQMRQIEVAHGAIDAARKDEIVKLEAKLAAATRELNSGDGAAERRTDRKKS